MFAKHYKSYFLFIKYYYSKMKCNAGNNTRFKKYTMFSVPCKNTVLVLSWLWTLSSYEDMVSIFSQGHSTHTVTQCRASAWLTMGLSGFTWFSNTSYVWVHDQSEAACECLPKSRRTGTGRLAAPLRPCCLSSVRYCDLKWMGHNQVAFYLVRVLLGHLFVRRMVDDGSIKKTALSWEGEGWNASRRACCVFAVQIRTTERQ